MISITSGVIVWSILAIELTLRWNSVTDVYEVQSTGQLIPLIIGVASSMKMFNMLALKYIKKVCWQSTLF